MSHKTKNQHRKGAFRHGENVEAPSEYGFATSDSPAPGAVEPIEEAPPARSMRAVFPAVKLVLGAVIVMGSSVAVAWGAHHFALHTPRFSIRAVDVEGSQRLTADRVAALGDIKLGSNLFALDIEGVKARLLTDPWIAEVQVIRQLPDRLQVSVVEHEACALALIQDRLFLVSRTGEPFKLQGEGDPYDLPVISGATPTSLVEDRHEHVERLHEALEILRAYEQMALGRAHVAQEVHWEADGSVVLTIGKTPITLHLGRGSWREKLLMAARVIDKTHVQGQLPGLIFLDNEAHPERVVVRMR